MITYLYWIMVIAVTIILCLGVSRLINWRVGGLTGIVVFLLAWGAYHFKYEQLFVKNYGGVMSIAIPEGQMHLSATWKEDHLWIENYDPKTNTCYFSEYSKGHLLEGQVVFKNCNPLLPRGANE
ncbi:MAG TPA: hypothetical protein VN030_02655 [Cellvibrio sp.]|nr:hypothetical protein [Cellvibrio sp.]